MGSECHGLAVAGITTEGRQRLWPPRTVASRRNSWAIERRGHEDLGVRFPYRQPNVVLLRSLRCLRCRSLRVADNHRLMR
jgi:hypothetical protein